MKTMRFSGLIVLTAVLGLMLGGCGEKEQTAVVDAGPDASEDIHVARDDTVSEMNKIGEPFGLAFEDVGEIKRHRGGSNDIATIYWPQGDITKAGLRSYRIDVNDEYEDDGKLQFRVGRKVLYSEEFVPEDLITVAAIPQSVLDAVKRGKSVTFGLYFEGRGAKKKTSTAKFKIVQDKKVSNRLQKMEASKHFARQTALFRELLKTKVLEDNRLYSEALVQYLGILQAFPETIQPFRGIVACCRRMKLKDTPLFTLASEHVSGKGGHAKTGRPGIAGATTSAGSSNLALRAPSFQERTPDGFKPSTINPESHSGNTAGPAASPSGTGATGPSTGVPTNRGVQEVQEALGHQASRMMHQAQELENGIKALKQQLGTMKSADEALAAAEEHVKNQTQAVTDAEAAVAAAKAAGRDPGPEANTLEAAKRAQEEAQNQALRAKTEQQAVQDQANGMNVGEIEEMLTRQEALHGMMKQKADEALKAFEQTVRTPVEKAAAENNLAEMERLGRQMQGEAALTKLAAATRSNERAYDEQKALVDSTHPKDDGYATKVARLKELSDSLEQARDAERAAQKAFESMDK